MQKHLAPFRRALRKQDQELFDELIERARQHQLADVQAANVEPTESILICILIEMLREQKRLQPRVDKLDHELRAEMF